ncbi:MAG: membrane protein insertase YidC, partial [Alphaproteobacteria bacterium]|nr:membrane protein insertase YidC [Alphaproteobacteria bacterium]
GTSVPSTAPVPAGAPPVPGQPAAAAPAAAAPATQQVATPRAAIDGPRLRGSISLVGGRIDRIVLKGYRETVSRASPEIVLFEPPGAPHPYFAEFGWSGGADAPALPNATSLWRADGDRLTADRPLTLTFDNGQGLVFTRRFEIDANFMFTVTNTVENKGDKPATAHPYALLSRTGTPPTQGFYILHEGPLGVFEGKLDEFKYDDLKDKRRIQRPSTGGWIGITDKYWLAALVPESGARVQASFTHALVDRLDKYQVDYLHGGLTVAPGGQARVVDRLFVGAKEVNLLDAYERQYAIALFDRAVDFGWFYFLTKPIFHAIDWLNRLLGNFGLAILALTVVIRLLFFPLANKSYRSMQQMKDLQPEMLRLRERFGEDRQRLNQAMMELYKREKVNPMAGCLPILLQIPVFFALYKVLFVAIEMRHAPFYGWVVDLSAPDPTTIFNLFGLIPWDPPAFFAAGGAVGLGVWPILMGITMFLQQKMNPAPPDPVQAKIFMFLPILFTFMLASFPAGLVIYWSWNNILSMAQQYAITRAMKKKS